jgi:hypothetical protein
LIAQVLLNVGRKLLPATPPLCDDKAANDRATGKKTDGWTGQCSRCPSGRGCKHGQGNCCDYQINAARFEPIH